MTTHVAILGGAFDPITNGHIQLAQFVLNSSKQFEQVWLVPCFKHRYNKKMTSPIHRLAMCELGSRLDSRISVCDYEIESKFSGETFNLLTNLFDSPLATNIDFSWIIGQDNANTFNKWYNYKELEKLVKFVVVPRKGIPVDFKMDWYLKEPHIYLKPDNNEVMEISSTEVRNMIKHQSNSGIIKKFINKKVYDYISNNNLYS